MGEEDYQITLKIGNRIYPKACLGCSEDQEVITTRLPFVGYATEADLRQPIQPRNPNQGFPFNLGLD